MEKFHFILFLKKGKAKIPLNQEKSQEKKLGRKETIREKSLRVAQENYEQIQLTTILTMFAKFGPTQMMTPKWKFWSQL